jgi:chromosomal replication initiation ATPase DnaA
VTIEKEMLQVIDRFCKTVKKVGSKKVLDTLENLYRRKPDNFEEKIIDFIKSECCSEFDILETDMYKSVVTDNAFVCRKMSMVLIKQHLDISHVNISILFGKKGHVYVSKSLSEHKLKNEKIKDDRVYLESYKRVNDKVIDYKNKFKE